MKTVIVKYNAGNVVSVTNALHRLGVEPEITDDPEKLRFADKVIFPGVGEASTAMNYLRSRRLDKVLINLKQPFLGICLGQQLMCRYSEENDTKCLGIYEIDVKKFPPKEKVPHIGWNKLNFKKGHSLFVNAPDNTYFYYVHSYYVEVGEDTIATSDYILPFSAAMQKNNFYAIQAHPEKSGKDGQIVLENFLNL